MKLLDVVRRKPVPEPWAEGEKIPWNDPAFSERMLREHLTQEHGAASRRSETIERHVAWIHELLQGRPARILDLACGPGLYTSRLAKRGHDCVGIDFSPASIAYARDQAENAGLVCRYLEEDLRTADYGEGYGLVMLIFGEFNVFRPADARAILEKAHRALAPGGLLLLEPHAWEAVVALGAEPPSWFSAEAGLYAAEPYLCLRENAWNAEERAATQRYYIVHAATGEVTRYAATVQAYTEDDYRSLLAGCGFAEVEVHPSLTGAAAGAASDLLVLLARKAR